MQSLFSSGSDPGQVLQSQAPRRLQPQLYPGELQTLVAGQHAFAFDLYCELRRQDGNLFFSPYSIVLALALVYAGATGDTAGQMKSVLHFDLPPERLHTALGALDLQVTKVSTQEEKAFQLRSANSLWVQQDFPFLPAFLDTLARNYGAGLCLGDFKQAPEAVRQAINAWVSRQTEERIKDLVPEGAITALTRLILANAIYFKAAWLEPFSQQRTRDDSFNLLDGTQVQVPFMVYGDPSDNSGVSGEVFEMGDVRSWEGSGWDTAFTLEDEQAAPADAFEAESLPQDMQVKGETVFDREWPRSLAYAAGDGCEAVKLPYVGETASMLLLVPPLGQFEAFEAGLGASQLEGIVNRLQIHPVTLKLPKFKFG